MGRCQVVFDANDELIGIEGELPGSTGVSLKRALTPEEMVKLTREYEVEFALGRERIWITDADELPTGAFWLFSGRKGPYGHEVSVPYQVAENIYVENIYHTHPWGKTTPSGNDIADLRSRFWQTTSGIIPVEDVPARVIWFDRLTPSADD